MGGDWGLWILGLQDEELRHDVVGRGVIHLYTEEDNAILEQLRVRVLALVAVRSAPSETGQDITVRRHLWEQCLRPSPVRRKVLLRSSLPLLNSHRRQSWFAFYTPAAADDVEELSIMVNKSILEGLPGL